MNKQHWVFKMGVGNFLAEMSVLAMGVALAVLYLMELVK